MCRLASTAVRSRSSRSGIMLMNRPIVRRHRRRHACGRTAPCEHHLPTAAAARHHLPHTRWQRLARVTSSRRARPRTPRILRQRPPSLRDPAAVAVGPRLSRTAGPAQPYLRATSGRTPHAPLHQRSRAPLSPHCKRDVGLSGYAHVPPARPNSTRPTEMRPSVF